MDKPAPCRGHNWRNKSGICQCAALEVYLRVRVSSREADTEFVRSILNFLEMRACLSCSKASVHWVASWNIVGVRVNLNYESNA